MLIEKQNKFYKRERFALKEFRRLMDEESVVKFPEVFKIFKFKFGLDRQHAWVLLRYLVSEKDIILRSYGIIVLKKGSSKKKTSNLDQKSIFDF